MGSLWNPWAAVASTRAYVARNDFGVSGRGCKCGGVCGKNCGCGTIGLEDGYCDGLATVLSKQVPFQMRLLQRLIHANLEL